jgi:hypothetical protein
VSDYAILVGISRYPNPGFTDLEGPPNDVALFEEWLRSPAGGAIPDDPDEPHIIRLITPEPYPNQFEPDEAPPTQATFERQFRRLVRSLDQAPGKRLYLYFSGHGFAERQRYGAHAAVYTADADDDFPMNIYGTRFAQMTLRKGWFEEVVLVMDCCRDSEINRRAAEPTIDEAFDVGSAAKGKLLAFYGAPFGGKAQERPIPDEDSPVHGLLTYSLVKAFREAPPDPAGRLTGQQLKNYIYAAWNNLCGDAAPDLPRIQTPDGADMVFPTPTERQGFAQRIRLPERLTASAELIVLGAQFNPLFTCRLQPLGQESRIEFPDRSTRSLEFDGRTLTLRLPVGMYQCEYRGVVPPREAALIVRGEGSVEL